MVNKAIFGQHDVKQNLAGGTGYAMSAKHELAQYISTGTFNDIYYEKATEAFKRVLEVTKHIDPEFLAKAAIYARQKAFMKDTPAFLLATLSVVNPTYFAAVFPKVVDNGKMLRNFVQIIRSGAVGRKSLGTRPKKEIQKWLNARHPMALFNDAIGNEPSLVDVIKLSRPKAATDERNALYAYIMGKEVNIELLPVEIQKFEAFKKDNTLAVPNVEFRRLSALELKPEHWKEIARTANWHTTRMNLNTFARHGVFEDKEITGIIADRLRDETAIKRSKVFPYQLFIAYKSIVDVPRPVIESLHDAMEVSTANVPSFNSESIWVMVDTSGSMSSPATGMRGSATTKVSYIDIAALFASVILRQNKDANILPFDTRVRCDIVLEPRDTVMTNTAKLSAMMGGGTNCGCALEHLNNQNRKADLVIYISDNESWYREDNHRSNVASQWNRFKSNNISAKMVCIDIAPYSDLTTPDKKNSVLNIGGFSDTIFTTIVNFVENKDANTWVEEIEAIKITDDKEV